MIINTCGRPRRCCPQIRVENGKYQIFDKKEGWETGFMTKDEVFNLMDAFDKVFYNMP